MSKQDLRPKGAISWMARHGVAANILMLICLIGGYMAIKNTRKEVFPNLTLDMVRIAVPYPGASPEEVETGIIQAVEEAVRGLDGVDEVTATASEGMGTVIVELLEGENLERLTQEIKSAVDGITSFPEDAEDPRVAAVSRKREVISLSIYGEAEERVLHELAEQIRDDLLKNPEITQVELSGVKGLEISVNVSQENLRRYGLTLQDIAATLSMASVDLPGGGIDTDNGEILVRVQERRDYGREFARIPIINGTDGSEVLLEDIAKITDGYEEEDHYGRYNNKPAVMIQVYRIGEQTPIEVADAVKELLPAIRENFPPGIGIDVLRDRSNAYRQRMKLLIRNGAIGLVLVLFILGLFLEIRLAFWVMMGIPVSFLGSFLFLPSLDLSINMVSMFAYIITLGIVVDDAIVIGENIYYYHQKGLTFMNAAIKGTRELAVPVTYSVLTNIVTFLPLYFIPGIMGKIFRMIPMVVALVFSISLLECLFILPGHLAHQKDRKRRGPGAFIHRIQQRFSNAFTSGVKRFFTPFLALVLKRRYFALCVGLAILIVSVSYAMSGRMGFSLFPSAESDFAVVDVVMPYGTPVKKTEAVMNRLYNAAQKVYDESGHPELMEGIFAELGRGGSHNLNIRIFLADMEIREKIMSTREFTKLWRKAAGDFPGAESITFSSDFGGPGHGSGITMELTHKDINILERASAELAKELSGYPLISDLDDGFQPGKQQLDITIKPEGKSLGLNPYSVARQIRNALYGAEVVRQQRGRNEIKIMVRLPVEERITEQDLNNLIIWTPSGKEILMREVVDVERGRAYTTITRRSGKRIVQVTANVTPKSKTGEIQSDIDENFLPGLLERYPGLSFSYEGQQANMRESLGSLKVGFILAMLCVFSLLAIPFRSYIQPLIVMVSIPFGIIGALAGHLIMGYSLSIISMFGIVALSGVVVNDALVLIDAANRRMREKGMTAKKAMLEAAVQRFRPIMLTTLTTFFGLMPMIMEKDFSTRFMIPMAISLGFGILFATAITLLLIPCLYMVVEDFLKIRSYLSRAWGKLTGAPIEDEEMEFTPSPKGEKAEA
jgi:multidrug efflux pump subunit AcrB